MGLCRQRKGRIGRRIRAEQGSIGIVKCYERTGGCEMTGPGGGGGSLTLWRRGLRAGN